MSDFMTEKVISYSSADDFQTCQRLYEFKHVRGLREPESQAMKFGTVMDFAFDEYYRTRSADAACAVIARMWTGDLVEDKGRTLERAQKVMRMYADRWQDDGIEVVVPAHRETVFFPLPDTPYRVAVRFDKIVKWAGTYRVMEHKTTSQLTSNTINRYDPNLQIKIYIWAARKLGIAIAPAIAGALVDITCINTTKIDFKRDVISSTSSQDAEVERTLIEICQDIERRSAAHSYVPNWGACMQYGECAFRRVCKHAPELRESIIRQDYARREDGTSTDAEQ
jgi:hypothetical protein